jgi:hypothetical protein
MTDKIPSMMVFFEIKLSIGFYLFLFCLSFSEKYLVSSNTTAYATIPNTDKNPMAKASLIMFVLKNVFLAKAYTARCFNRMILQRCCDIGG